MTEERELYIILNALSLEVFGESHHRIVYDVFKGAFNSFDAAKTELKKAVDACVEAGAHAGKMADVIVNPRKGLECDDSIYSTSVVFDAGTPSQFSYSYYITKYIVK